MVIPRLCPRLTVTRAYGHGFSAGRVRSTAPGIHGLPVPITISALFLDSGLLYGIAGLVYLICLGLKSNFQNTMLPLMFIIQVSRMPGFSDRFRSSSPSSLSPQRSLSYGLLKEPLSPVRLRRAVPRGPSSAATRRTTLS